MPKESAPVAVNELQDIYSKLRDGNLNEAGKMIADALGASIDAKPPEPRQQQGQQQRGKGDDRDRDREGDREEHDPEFDAAVSRLQQFRGGTGMMESPGDPNKARGNPQVVGTMLSALLDTLGPWTQGGQGGQQRVTKIDPTLIGSVTPPCTDPNDESGETMLPERGVSPDDERRLANDPETQLADRMERFSDKDKEKKEKERKGKKEEDDDKDRDKDKERQPAAPPRPAPQPRQPAPPGPQPRQPAPPAGPQHPGGGTATKRG